MENFRPLYEIANDINNDWNNIYFGAWPYVKAMYKLNDINDMYHFDTAESIVRYFLANAKTWRGERAREIKRELNKMLQK